MSPSVVAVWPHPENRWLLERIIVDCSTSQPSTSYLDRSFWDCQPLHEIYRSVDETLTYLQECLFPQLQNSDLLTDDEKFTIVAEAKCNRVKYAITAHPMFSSSPPVDSFFIEFLENCQDPSKPKTKSPPIDRWFSREEQRHMYKFVVDSYRLGRQAHPLKINFWKQAKAENVTAHTMTHMQEGFRRFLLPNIPTTDLLTEKAKQYLLERLPADCLMSLGANATCPEKDVVSKDDDGYEHMQSVQEKRESGVYTYQRKTALMPGQVEKRGRPRKNSLATSKFPVKIEKTVRKIKDDSPEPIPTPAKKPTTTSKYRSQFRPEMSKAVAAVSLDGMRVADAASKFKVSEMALKSRLFRNDKETANPKPSVSSSAKHVALSRRRTNSTTTRRSVTKSGVVIGEFEDKFKSGTFFLDRSEELIEVILESVSEFETSDGACKRVKKGIHLMIFGGLDENAATTIVDPAHSDIEPDTLALYFEHCCDAIQRQCPDTLVRKIVKSDVIDEPSKNDDTLISETPSFDLTPLPHVDPARKPPQNKYQRKTPVWSKRGRPPKNISTVEANLLTKMAADVVKTECNVEEEEEQGKVKRGRGRPPKNRPSVKADPDEVDPIPDLEEQQVHDVSESGANPDPEPMDESMDCLQLVESCESPAEPILSRSPDNIAQYLTREDIDYFCYYFGQLDDSDLEVTGDQVTSVVGGCLLEKGLTQEHIDRLITTEWWEQFCRENGIRSDNVPKNEPEFEECIQVE